MKEENYDFLTPDKRFLDEECVHQPALFFKWSEKASKAELKLGQAKRNLLVVQADVAKEIRKNPSKYGLKENPSEASINSLLPTQPKVRDATDDIETAQYNLNLMYGVVKALEQRKSMLEILEKQEARAYFATPKVSVGEKAEAVDRIRKQIIREKTHKQLEE
jgi:hypothetical protein